MRKKVLALELHELGSLGMLLFVFVLYAFGLSWERIAGGGQHIIDTFGWVERSVLLMVLVLAAVAFLVPKLQMRIDMKLLIRVLLSFFAMLVLFETVSYFISAKQLPLKDLDLQKADRLIFGGKQPAEWLAGISFPALTDLLSTAYVSWFALTYGTIFLMAIRSRRAVLEFATVALTTFYIGYLLYMVVPAYGPIFTYHYATSIGGLTSTLLSRPPSADAFPSLHTAISVVMMLQVWKHWRKWTWLYAPLTAMIVFSTIYLRIHYGIDVIAGIVLALLTTKFCPLLLDWWAGKRAGTKRPDVKKAPVAEPVQA